MNTKSKIVAGIDIGSSKISSLIAQVSTDFATLESTISIVGASSVTSKGVKKGQIVDIDEAVDAAINAVESSERMAGYHLDTAFVSVGGGHIESQNSTGVVAVSDPAGEINHEDVERVIDAAKAVSHPASREIIHIIPRQYIVDGEAGIKDPIGMSGVRLEVETHLVTASSAALKNLTKCVNEVGINISELVFSGLASSFAVLSDTEKELGCVLIDIGGGTTSIAAFTEGALSYSATLPIGAKNVTNDLAIGLRVSLDSSEKIKLALAEDKRSKDEQKSDLIDIAELGADETKKVSRRTLIEGIIKPRLNEIFTMVKLDLEKRGLVNRVPSGAIITGGGALTIGSQESAKRMLGLPVRIGVPQGITGLIDDIMNPSFAASVGLILYGAKKDYVERSNSLPSFAKKIKLPSSGLFGKLAETIRDLLP